MCSWLVGNLLPNSNSKTLTHCILHSAVFKACSLNSSIHIYLEKKTNKEKCRFAYFLWARSKYGAQHFCSHIMGLVTWPYLGRRIRSVIFLRRKEIGWAAESPYKSDIFWHSFPPHTEHTLSSKKDNPRYHIYIIYVIYMKYII